MTRSFLNCTLFAAWLLIASVQGARAQAVFPMPEAGASAFVDALASNDDAAMQVVLGSDFRRFIPAQDVNQDDVYRFLGAWSQGHEIVSEPASEKKPAVVHIAVGTDGWTLPIPLVETQRGWRFDPVAGRNELLTRRIGRNERAAMRTSLAYLDAQRDYRALTHHYAQRLVSRPGQRDGLYWPATQGEMQSPLGPLAIAMQQGNGAPAGGYHGYHYRILTAQGAHENGGRKNHEQDGVLADGCALVAWPVTYGATGVMTFLVNDKGKLVQKNFGPQTTRIVGRLSSFDPDESWSPVKP
ncbi:MULTISPECIES: DUF2950 domain-containing protein [unclassified Caballeronia]|uniref:DUF2950 domain-containing protein n=1 Tax=unclassified Caballeronia TaxID=2646786 RepID=UPI0028593662|nr:MULTISPECIES: DUF2950 domain-containing protein [unclassified Caballeronia]MDR5755086.1 DUF2950 domain-containing protein [Caballeronia sp. LZ024]MDR5841551.1 DUF2950 domain-containing protein [Caballeronia sp. LZ031]